MKRISVYVPENAVIEAISPPYRLFKTANELLTASGKKPFFDVEYVALNKTVVANDGEYNINIDRKIDTVIKTDLIILPAIYGKIEIALEANKNAIPWIQKMYMEGSEVASLCIGAFILAETGLVDNKKCSLHWLYYNEFKERYPQVEIVNGGVITDEGKIYSSGGANSLWNLLLYLLEKYTDRETSIMAAKFFAIDIDRNNQGAFTIFKGQKEHKDKEILKVQSYIEGNYQEKITILSLAGKTNMSRRSFERRFKQATDNSTL